jgi:hypothetical protein
VSCAACFKPCDGDLCPECRKVAAAFQAYEKGLFTKDESRRYYEVVKRERRRRRKT